MASRSKKKQQRYASDLSAAALADHRAFLERLDAERGRIVITKLTAAVQSVRRQRRAFILRALSVPALLAASAALAAYLAAVTAS